MASHADAETPGASSQGEAPKDKADAGESGAVRTPDGKSDLKGSIMSMLKSDTPVHDEGKSRMDELAEKRRALQSQRKKLTADLRNESRKRKRIQQRAQYLTDDDLVEAIAMRANRKNQSRFRRGSGTADIQRSRGNGIDAWPFEGGLRSAMPTAEAVLCTKISRRNRRGVG